MTPEANDLCVFAIKRGTLDSRLDTHFYNPLYMSLLGKLLSKPYTTLGEIATFSNETTDYSEFIDGVFEYLEISGVSLLDNYYTTTTIDVNKVPSRAKMKTQKGDIVISLTRPHRGAMAIINEDHIIASTGFSVIREVVNSIHPKWLLYTLFSNSCLVQLLQRSSGGNYPAIIGSELEKIIIPKVTKEKQIQMVSFMDSAITKRNRQRAKANELLIALPKMLMEALEISFDSKKFQLAYSTHLTEVFGRIDADFYSPKFVHFRKQIEEGKYASVYIGDIAQKIVTGFAAGKQDQADELPDEERVTQLRPFSITPEGELSFETQKYVPKNRVKNSDYCQKNEVIFNNTNSPDLVGKTTVFDSDVLCTTSNHMTRIIVKDGVNPYYVSYFFNLLLSIGYWKLLCTNFNNQAGVNIETLKSVKIPLPDIETQNAIVAKIMGRRSEANRLRKEAEQEWREAKKQFEKELLGE